MGQEQKNISKGRTKYTAQFKDLVLARVEKEGVPQVAKDLKIANSMIYDWRAKQQSGGTSLEKQKINEAEFAKLKRENARLNEELSFLKKAAVYFAKESRQNTP